MNYQFILTTKGPDDQNSIDIDRLDAGLRELAKKCGLQVIEFKFIEAFEDDD